VLSLLNTDILILDEATAIDIGSERQDLIVISAFERAHWRLSRARAGDSAQSRIASSRAAGRLHRENRTHHELLQKRGPITGLNR